MPAVRRAARIPSVNGATAQALPGTAGATAAPVTTQQSIAPASGEQNNIAFLCPNGHRLVGPARLQGQAGQCPHCGARFLVPMLNEMERVEEVDLTDLPRRGRSAAAIGRRCCTACRRRTPAV